MTAPSTGSVPEYNPAPNTGAQQYSQPQQGQSGNDQSAQQQYGQPSYDQYGQQQYSQPGYDQSSQQQYGQPQQYGQSPVAPAYGYGAPTGSQRPAIATATGVVGIVIGVLVTVVAMFALIGTAIYSDLGTSGGQVAEAWITSILYLAGGIMLLVGAIQLLSGSNSLIVRIGAALCILGALVNMIWGLANGAAGVTTIVVTIVLIIFPGLVLALSMNAEITRWLATKKATTVSGY